MRSVSVKRAVAAAVSALIFISSPGLGAYRAFAAAFAAPSAVSQTAGRTAVPAIVPGAVPLQGAALNGLDSSMQLGLNSVLPSVGGLSIAGNVKTAVPSAAAGIQAAAPRAQAAAPAGIAQTAAAPSGAKTVTRIARGVVQVLESAGPITQADPSQARSLGADLGSLLSGGVSGNPRSSVLAPVASRLGSLGNFSTSDGGYFAKPAGKDAIEAAVQAANKGETPAPVKTQAPKKAPGYGWNAFMTRIPALIISAAGFAVTLADPLAGGGIAAVLALLLLPELTLPKSLGRLSDLRNKLAGFAAGAGAAVFIRQALFSAAISPWYAYVLAIGLPALLALFAQRTGRFRKMADESFDKAMRERFAQGRALMGEVYETARWMAYDGRMKVESPYMELIKWNQVFDFMDRTQADKGRPTIQEAGELRRMLEPLLEFYKFRLVERYPDWGWEKKREYKAKADAILEVLQTFERSSSLAVRPAGLNGAVSEGRAHRKSPFLPKLISAGLAVLPAALLGWPLIGAGSAGLGAAVIAASAGLMALPFMNERTSKTLRSVPGFLLLGLGGYTLVTAILAGSGIVMGAMAALAGWGLIRYGRSNDADSYYDSEKVLTAFFGALAAVAGAGLALAGPSLLLSAASPAWLVWTVKLSTWAAYPLTALLYMHLPSWVGEGIEAMFRGLFSSIRGVHRVLGSLKRDTVLRERLEHFTKRWLKRSPWNAIWLGGIWIPVWVSEGVMFLLSAAAGTVLGVAQAPLIFAWGSVYELWQDSKLTKFLAAWNHTIFDYGQGSKITVYNRFAKPLAALANSQSKVKSWPAAAGLRVLQLVWLGYTLTAFVPLTLWGFIRAFSRVGEEFDRKKHSPSYLKASRDDRPDVDRPDEPEDPDQPPSKSSFFPRLAASSIAVLPLYFLALPMLTQPLGWLYIAASVGMALMPFTPAKTPKALRQVPGYLMVGLGLATATVIPWLTFGSFIAAAGILTTNAFWMGVVTALAGWGFIRYTGKGGPEKERWYSVDDPEYIGAFFGALGVLTGVGVAMLGLTGWVPLLFKVGGYLTSIFLLMHLPKWMGDGVSSAFEGIWHSMTRLHRSLGFWHRDTEFYDNLGSHSKYWLKKSIWNGSWLSVVWVPTWAMMAVEFVLAGVVGSASGLVKAPLNFLWGAAYRLSPDSRVTRFIAGFARAVDQWTTNSKDTVLDRLVKPFVGAMNEHTEGSGRPTLKAAGAFLLARVAQLFWFAAVVLPLPVLAAAAIAMAYFPGLALLQSVAALALMQVAVLTLAALIMAVINMTGEKKPPVEDEDGAAPEDPDDPDSHL